ncbi:MAG: outer membrane beta-barrel domain-containing protein, partial [Bdellovibrionales bacterium]|nr:outer membrane beta-barrel domain-containing protein [Bdellovibrionales bacterium]
GSIFGTAGNLNSALAEEAETLNIDSIKQKYWARGDESELGVVQNRAYSKGKKLEVGLMSGVTFSDPFLTIQQVGVDAGWHLSESIGFHLLAWKSLVGSSSALRTFEQEKQATTNTNKPRDYVGAEMMGSLLYGKLSVLGKSIIYYDFHLLAGVGSMGTESGRYFSPSIGIGQRFYLTRTLSIRLDYRLQYFREAILEKQIVTKIGQTTGERNNWSNTINIGVSFLLGKE